MDAVSDVVTVPASSDTITITQESTNTFNVNQSNNNTHTHANAHISSNSLANKTTSNVISSSSSNSNINIAGSIHSRSSNSSCSNSSTSSNSSGYGSSTTTPTNNYDLQQTTPTTTPIPTTPIATAQHIIPVATVAAVTPFYNESITAHNLETHHVQHHHLHSQQQQQQHQQPHQHHLLQSNHPQYPESHLQTNLQQQHYQYLPRQQYYSPYDYQQTAPTHNLSGSTAEPAVASYNMIVPGPYEMSSSLVNPSYAAEQYKSSSLTGASTNYERSSVVKTHAPVPSYNQQHSQTQQLQQQGEQQQPKVINQQTHHFTSLLGSSKQRSSSLISGTTNTNTSKPQAAATPFYANPTPFYENFKHKMPLEYHDAYTSSSPTAAASYHQQQKFYVAAKSQLKESAYASPTGLNSKSLYGNTGNFFPAPSAGLNLSSATYDKYSMYPHSPATGYSTTGHLGNDTPPEVSNYRKPVVANPMNSPSWPWGIEYASGNSRSIPPPATHIPTATVAPTHATHLTQNPPVLARDPYYMAHDKYGVKYDKYSNPSYQQSYASPPTNRHMWPNTPHTPNLSTLNDRHLLATVPPALPSHGLHTASYFPNTSATSLNSRQSCCSQPYQSQNCYFPASHTVPTRQPHTQPPTVGPSTGGYLTPQPQTFGQSPHLNALTASCKYGGALTDYGPGNKFKNSNDLYLNTHQYDNNPAPHNFGFGSAHNSQPLYNSNAHQSMTHGTTPAPLLTNDPLGSKPTSYTNDLTFTTSNFDNYHSHLDTHSSQQTITGIHDQQPPPPYGVTVAKRALLDYRKPIQPQPPPPPTIADDCYTALNTRDHYNQHELLNTPETTTTFGEYETHKSHNANIATEVLSDSYRDRDENNKNLSLRDFIANWNDDEDEYQNNEEINFDQDTVINEVLQTASVDQEEAAAVVAVEEVKVIKPFLADTKDNEFIESVNAVEDLSATLSDAEASQYVNLPDIVIDIEKSNNVNNSITTPTTSPPAPPSQEDNSTSMILNNFDVEKELDELNLKKPAQQELSKDLNDDKDISNVIVAPHLSPCKNLTFEDLNLEAANKTVLNATAAGLTTNHSSDLTEQYIEGYESSSSRHSNESAFEKEYETFINKITSESCAKKAEKAESAAAVDVDSEKEVDFEKNVHNFSKFHKRKRKLKEDEVNTTIPAIQSKKKLKAAEVAKVNNSNFPQAYTKKSRNKLTTRRIQGPHKRKPMSSYYKIIHSIRRFGLYRAQRVREYMAELKEKHLPLIKRQSIKNYTHDINESLYNAKSLKALCIMAINTKEFRECLLLSMAETKGNISESEEKHICTDPSCETCEVIKSLMEAESFETTLIQQAAETNEESGNCASTIFCAEGVNGTITIFETTPNTDDLSFRNVEPILISNEITNFEYSKENFPDEFGTKNLEKQFLNTTAALKIVAQENLELENCVESCVMSALNLQAKDNLGISLEESLVRDTEELKSMSTNLSFPARNHSEILGENNIETDEFVSENVAHHSRKSPYLSCELNDCDELQTAKSTSLKISFSEQNSNIFTSEKAENSENLVTKFPEITENSNNSSIKDTLTKILCNNDKVAAAKHEDESENEDSDSSDSETDDGTSSSDSENKSIVEKSNSNNESSGTDTETDTDNETETSNSDSDESHHSENITSIRKPRPDCRKKETDNSSRADIDSGDENIPSSSPQRIVIRITKSLSPNDQSLRVENIFGKSSKLQVEAESETDSRENEDSRQVSNALSKEDCVPEKSLGALEYNFNKENNTVTNVAPLKLILRKQDLSKEQPAEKYEIGKNLNIEFKNEHIDQKMPEENETILKLSRKQEYSRGEIFFKQNTARECEYHKFSEVVRSCATTPSPRKEEEVSDNSDGDDENKSQMVSANYTSKEKKIEIGEDTFFEKSVEAYGDRNGSVDLSKEIFQDIPTFLNSSSKSDDRFEEFSAATHNESFSRETISESKTETVSTPRKIIVEEIEVFKKSIQSHSITESEVENKEESLRLKLTQNDISENNDFQQEENQFRADVFNTNPELKSNKTTSKISINEYSSQNNTVLTEELKVNTESRAEDEICDMSELSPREDHRTESVSGNDDLQEIMKKNTDYPEDHGHTECSAVKEIEKNKSDMTSNKKLDCNNTEAFSENIETYDLTTSESEEEQSDVESILSVSESSYDSEYESDDSDKISEAVVRLNNSKPIVISDDDSIDNCNSKKQVPRAINVLRKLSQEDLQKIESNSEFISVKETQESSTEKEEEQTDLASKHSDNSMNLLNIIAKDLQVIQHPEDEKESVAFDYGSSDEDTHSETEFSNARKPLDEKRVITDVETYSSEHSSSEEDFFDDSDDKMSDKSTQKKIESNSEFISVKETQESSTEKEEEQTDLASKHSDNSMNLLNTTAKDLQVIQHPEDEKESLAFNYGSSDEDTHSETEFSNARKRFDEKRARTDVEEYSSEHSSSEEDFSEDSDDKMSDQPTQKYEEFLQLADQSVTNLSKSNDDDKDVFVEYSSSPKIGQSISDTQSPIQSENLLQISDCENENDIFQKSEIKINEGFTSSQKKHESQQMLSGIIGKTKDETTESQEKIDNSKSVLQAKVENPRAHSQTVDATDPELRSTIFISENQKLSEESKSFGNDFDENISENSIVETKTYTLEHPTSMPENKDITLQDVKEDSITTEEVYKSNKLQNEIEEETLLDTGRVLSNTNANTSLSVEAEASENKIRQIVMKDEKSNKQQSDIFKEDLIDIERLPVNANANTNIREETKDSDNKTRQIVMEDGNSSKPQIDIFKVDLTESRRAPANVDANTNTSAEAEVLENTFQQTGVQHRKSNTPQRDVFEEDLTELRRSPVNADANTNISEESEVIENKYQQISVQHRKSKTSENDIPQEDLTELRRASVNIDANPNVSDEAEDLESKLQQTAMKDIKPNEPQCTVFEEDLTESTRLPLNPDASMTKSKEAIVLENIFSQTVVEVRISNNSKRDVLEEDLTDSGTPLANADANTNISEEGAVLSNNFNEVVMEDGKTQHEEKIICEDLKSPPAATCTPTEEKIIPQNYIEEEIICNKKNPRSLEDNILVIKETTAEKIYAADVNLEGPKEANLARELLPITAEEHSIDSFIPKDTTDESQSEETETTDDSKDVKEPLIKAVSENTEIISEEFIPNPNISPNFNNETPQSSSENNIEFDHTVSERMSKTENDSSERRDSVPNHEIVVEISNEKEITTENNPTESENTLQVGIVESSGSIVINGDTKTSEEILKTAEETSIQSISANLEIVKETKAEHSENISDFETTPPLSNQAKESKDKHLEEIFSEVEAKKTTTTTEELEVEGESKQKVSSENLEETPVSKIVSKEVYKATKPDDIVEDQNIISKDISSSDSADVMDEVGHESISQENVIRNLAELPTEVNLIRSSYKSAEVILEKTNKSEVKLESGLKYENSSNLEEKSIVDVETSSLAKDNLILDSESSEEQVLNNSKTITTSDQLECGKPEAAKTSEAEHAPSKDCNTSNDMSTDFFGFKNQSSFEDESEDFHGFEDLEEVTRIRQEMEKLNDDSTANDGFLNIPTLNRQIHKSTTASLTDSMSSEVNELEALEKELSQHQPDIQAEDDDKETEQDLRIKPNEIASTNDIEHIKQMLESDEELQTDGEDKFEKITRLCKNTSVENSNNHISKYILSSVSSIIPKLSDLCRAALNSSSNSNSNLAQQANSETSTFVVERELSVEEAFAEMYRQAGVLLSDPEDCDNDMPSPAHNETHDVLLINLQEILNSDNNDVYVLQCNMNENVLNVVQSTEDSEMKHQDNETVNTERVNTVKIILDTQNSDPQIHIISSDSESEVIILSDDDSEFSYRPLSTSQERVTIPFINDNDINDSDGLFDISTIHHEEIVPDNLNKFLQEEFYKYLHEKYVQRNISKYYHANRVLKKYKRRFIRTNRQ